MSLIVRSEISNANRVQSGYARQFELPATINSGPYSVLLVEKSELVNLPEPAREQFLKYAYLNPKTNKYILCFDDARFFNHSDNANCIDVESPDDSEGIDIAAKDIQDGEELTCNYKEFDADFDYKMSMH